MNKKEENKEKTAELYNSGLKIREIAESIGVSVGTVNRDIKELREEGKVKNINKKEIEKSVLELYNQGVEIKEIAERLKLPVGTINIYTKKLRKEGIIQSRKLIKSIEMQETKEKILELYNQGIKIEEIAKKLDLSDSTVYRAIRKLNDERKVSGFSKKERKEMALELYNEGIEIKEIAKRLNVTVETINTYIKELEKEGRIEKRNLSRKSIKKKEKKEKNKEKILELHNIGLGVKEIENRLNLSDTTVYKYIKELKDEGKIKVINREERKEKALELYNQGIEIKEIAKRLDVTVVTINTYIRELEKEGKIKKRERKSIKKKNTEKEIDIEKESIDIQKRVNKDDFKEKDYQKFSEYILHCKERLDKRKLKRDELVAIKKVVDITYKYNDIIFYIKACIHFGQALEAKKAVNGARASGEFSPEQREKLNELYRKIIEVEKKKAAIIMLKRGNGVLEVAKSSGLSETEVIKLNRKLLEKQKTSKAVGTAGEGR